MLDLFFFFYYVPHGSSCFSSPAENAKLNAVLLGEGVLNDAMSIFVFLLCAFVFFRLLFLFLWFQESFFLVFFSDFLVPH